MMNSRRICPADCSQYKDSAVGLVFMESAAGLAMETSKVESAVRNQAEAKLNQLEHTASAKERSESAGTGIEKSAWVIDQRRRFQAQVTVDESVSSRNYKRNAKISRRSDCAPRRKKINLLLLKNIQAKQLINQLDNQTQATAHPVESFYEPVVAMQDDESSRKIISRSA
ncbi:hypothetical protein F511_41516 [Dorcoceras hygrometricum]|uniref:Uncharacterized protein n=1 Tax=Dorcoceras hygrometricum TaxID=472368 RepID=A0A2Z7ACT8_9LAMI|nr:hypothetical protein F511_41516 [Dorcoceras hygrometricum]